MMISRPAQDEWSARDALRPARSLDRGSLRAVAMLLPALLLVYWRAGTLGYVLLDDYGYVVDSEIVRAGLSAEGVRWAFTTLNLENWHPLTWISLMLDVSLFGDSAAAHHVVNVAMHGISSLLVYRLAFRLLKHWWAAYIAALVFLVHPLHVESVAWISERKDLLCAIFYLLALEAYLVQAEESGRRCYWIAFLWFLLAAASKPMAVSLPIVLVLLDQWPLRRFENAHGVSSKLARLQRCVLEKTPFVLVAMALAAITLVAQRGAMQDLQAAGVLDRFANAIVAVGVYLRQFVWPTGLAAFYPLKPVDWIGAFVPALLLCTLLGALAWRYRHSSPWAWFGVQWFIVTLLPVIGIVQVGGQSHADRYMYLPSVGLIVALAGCAIGLVERWRRLVVLVLLPALAFHAFIAWIQVGYWTNSPLLLSRIMQVSGPVYEAQIGLAAYLLNARKLDSARVYAESALRQRPGSNAARSLLAGIALAERDFDEAVRVLRELVREDTADSGNLNNLGIALAASGRAAEARDCFAASFALDRYRPGVRENLVHASAAAELNPGPACAPGQCACDFASIPGN